MDFDDFIKKHKEIINSHTNSTKLKKDTPLTSQRTTHIKVIQTPVMLKQGDFVVVIRKSNSILNYYKGYVGQIKSYVPQAEYAMVYLDCILSRAIKFPISHLSKI